jgi:oligopeptidase A
MGADPHRTIWARLSVGLAHAVLMAGAVLMVLPMLWMLATSFKPPAEISVWPPQWLPQAPTWDNFVAPLADAGDRLARAWGQISHLNAVVNTPELREAYNLNLPKITAFYTDFGQDERLFARYRALASATTFASLDPARRKLVDNALRDFRLSGAELPPVKKARLKAVDEELATLSSRYEDNVLDATNAWELYIDDAAALAGVPSDVLAAARQDAAADGKSGWKLSLRMPCYLPVMQYAENRDLRETGSPSLAVSLLLQDFLHAASVTRFHAI